MGHLAKYHVLRVNISIKQPNNVNVLIQWIGMERFASHALKAKPLMKPQKHVNVHILWDGMVLFAREFQNAQEVNNGMYTHTPANVLVISLKSMGSVWKSQYVRMGWSWTLRINVCVLRKLIGMEKVVFLPTAEALNIGMEPNVPAGLASTSMIEHALNASMGKSGILIKRYANVKMGMNGLGTIVRNNLNVQMEEYGMQPIKDASAQKIITGLESCVNLNRPAAVGKSTTKIPINANVWVGQNGMGLNVLNARMAKSGMSQPGNVCVLQGPSGTITSVLWLWSVEEGWFGIKIPGHVNAHPIQSGMAIFVFQTLALQEECGMKLINHANAQIIKYGKMMPVFPPKLLAPMARSGIQPSTHAAALMAPSNKSTVVIRSHIAEVRRYITLTIINANALMA